MSDGEAAGRTAMEAGLQGTPAKGGDGGAVAPFVTLTPAALSHLRALITEQDIPEDERNLRIAVRVGGCSGFSYELGFDRRNEGDASTVVEGMPVVVDGASLAKVRGLTVDFVDTVQEQGFKITNPNAVSSCGCGKSFQA